MNEVEEQRTIQPRTIGRNHKHRFPPNHHIIERTWISSFQEKIRRKKKTDDGEAQTSENTNENEINSALYVNIFCHGMDWNPTEWSNRSSGYSLRSTCMCQTFVFTF
jgi:hypothetical protein